MACFTRRIYLSLSSSPISRDLESCTSLILFIYFLSCMRAATDFLPLESHSLCRLGMDYFIIFCSLHLKCPSKRVLTWAWDNPSLKHGEVLPRLQLFGMILIHLARIYFSHFIQPITSKLVFSRFVIVKVVSWTLCLLCCLRSCRNPAGSWMEISWWRKLSFAASVYLLSSVHEQRAS